jgi:hypothetical protein
MYYADVRAAIPLNAVEIRLIDSLGAIWQQNGSVVTLAFGQSGLLR